MESFFLFCLAFGALFTLASVVMGAIGGGLDGIHGAGHGDGGVIGHDPGAVHSGDGQAHGIPLLAYLNLSSIMAFLMWFGAMGLVALKFLLWPVALVMAASIGVGVAGGSVVGWAIVKLRSGETHMRLEDYRKEGTVAEVIVSISAGGVGEIVYSQMGGRHAEAARASPGVSLPRGSRVVITGYERGIATVEEWTAFIEEPAEVAKIAPTCKEPEGPPHHPNLETETDRT